MNKWLFTISVILALVINAGADEWRKIMPEVEFNFPRDHGAHFDTKVEWWYFTGTLKTESGRLFGIQATFFRHGLSKDPKQNDDAQLEARQLLIGHLAVADVQSQTFRFTERMRRIGGGFAGASQKKMNVWIGDWQLEQDEDETMRFTASAPEIETELNITWTPQKPFVKQGENGYSQKGEETGNASAYISYTRLQTEAELIWQGETYNLSGLSWFDHEFGTSQLGEKVVGWDWWGLHLDDGRDLMLYQLRNDNGEPTAQSSGTLVSKEGEATHLSVDDFTLTPKAYWQSESTEARYPVEWQVEIPDHDIAFDVKPYLKHTEMVTDQSSGVTYWEGPVQLSGKTSGAGYMELTGYADNLQDQF